MTQLLAQSSVHREPLSVLLQHTEPQEVEGLRLAQSSLRCRFSRRKAPELNQPGLVRVQRQPELLQPLATARRKRSASSSCSKPATPVVGVTHDDHVASGMAPPPLLHPQVEDVVQVDVGQQRTDATALATVPISLCSILPSSSTPASQPLLDQPHDALRRPPVLHELDQPSSVDGVEGTPDTLPISKTFRRQCALCAEVMPSKGKNSRCSAAASVQASCIYC